MLRVMVRETRTALTDWNLIMLTAAVSTAVAYCGPWAGPWVGGFGWFFLLIPLFWIAVFTFAGRRWRRAARNGYSPGYGMGGSSRSAEQTLSERFAQGDIDEVEYRARLEVLRANRPSAS
jgi:putative membrane protein